MAVFSVIKLSGLEGAKRIDAEYYKPDYLSLILKIKSRQFNSLKSLADRIFSGPFGSTLKSESYQEDGIPFIRIGDISDIFIEKKRLVYISEAEHKRIFNTYLNPGDIVFSKIGTIGRLSIISDDLGQVNISENNIGIRLSKLSLQEKTSLLFFLLTNYGQLQIMRAASGNIQQKLNVLDIENIKVPIFSVGFQHQLWALYNNIEKLKKRSQSLYSQAENLLLEELGLKDFKPKYEKTYTANLSSAFSAHRIDAEYFQPAYEEVIEKLREKNIELKPLRKFILTVQKGIEPGSENYQDEGKPFIRVSNLSIYGFTDRDQKYLGEELYQQLRETYEPKQGDFLLTKDATPGIAYVVKERTEGVISSGILKLQINESEINKEYLALCVNSIIGKVQIERDGGGSVILHWKPEQVKRLKTPILPLSTQRKIASLVQQSHEARKKAKELLELAKKAVGIAIENDEEEALGYIRKRRENKEALYGEITMDNLTEVNRRPDTEA
jgi:restriction endonuclease S subunit